MRAALRIGKCGVNLCKLNMYIFFAWAVAVVVEVALQTHLTQADFLVQVEVPLLLVLEYFKLIYYQIICSSMWDQAGRVGLVLRPQVKTTELQDL